MLGKNEWLKFKALGDKFLLLYKTRETLSRKFRQKFTENYFRNEQKTGTVLAKHGWGAKKCNFDC